MMRDFNRHARAIGWIVLPFVAACSSAPRVFAPASMRGDVRAHELAIPGSERYDHSANVKYLQAIAYAENPMPAYPPELLVHRLPPIVVAARLIVGVNGAVSRVDSLDATMTAEHARLFDTVRETCLRWRFTPLMRLDLAAGSTTVIEGETTTTYPGRPTALPFHLDYAFNFSQQGGRPQVEAKIESTSR